MIPPPALQGLSHLEEQWQKKAHPDQLRPLSISLKHLAGRTTEPYSSEASSYISYSLIQAPTKAI